MARANFLITVGTIDSDEVDALREAVEVLESVADSAKTRSDWYYREGTELIHERSKWAADKVTAENAARASERRYQEQRAECHRLAAQVAKASRTIDAILTHATIRQLATNDDLKHERTPEFWHRLVNQSD